MAQCCQRRIKFAGVFSLKLRQKFVNSCKNSQIGGNCCTSVQASTTFCEKKTFIIFYSLRKKSFRPFCQGAHCFFKAYFGLCGRRKSFSSRKCTPGPRVPAVCPVHCDLQICLLSQFSSDKNSSMYTLAMRVRLHKYEQYSVMLELLVRLVSSQRLFNECFLNTYGFQSDFVNKSRG